MRVIQCSAAWQQLRNHLSTYRQKLIVFSDDYTSPRAFLFFLLESSQNNKIVKKSNAPFVLYQQDAYRKPNTFFLALFVGQGVINPRLVSLSRMSSLEDGRRKEKNPYTVAVYTDRLFIRLVQKPRDFLQNTNLLKQYI
jgi:hypothetical protein